MLLTNDHIFQQVNKTLMLCEFNKVELSIQYRANGCRDGVQTILSALMISNRRIESALIRCKSFCGIILLLSRWQRSSYPNASKAGCYRWVVGYLFTAKFKWNFLRNEGEGVFRSVLITYQETLR